jgi:hypothetical protein
MSTVNFSGRFPCWRLRFQSFHLSSAPRRNAHPTPRTRPSIDVSGSGLPAISGSKFIVSMATADRSPGIIGYPLANTVPSSTRSGALSVAVASSLLFLHPCPLAEWWTSLPVGICSHLYGSHMFDAPWVVVQ